MEQPAHSTMEFPAKLRGRSMGIAGFVDCSYTQSHRVWVESDSGSGSFAWRVPGNMDCHNREGFGGGRWDGDLSQPTVPITAPTILKADQILVMDGGA